jgi:hypothetical protein
MISNMTFRLNQYSQALSIFLGCIILTLLFYVSITDNEPFYIFDWATSVLGTTFILMISFLILISILCIINVCGLSINQKKFWFETGLQSSNLISTIALTYTLLGISLGIGELSSSKLDVETINETISKLTEQFSMAFMTSVIGLPLSGFLRSVLIICYEYYNKQTKILNQYLLK